MDLSKFSDNHLLLLEGLYNIWIRVKAVIFFESYLVGNMSMLGKGLGTSFKLSTSAGNRSGSNDFYHLS